MNRWESVSRPVKVIDQDLPACWRTEGRIRESEGYG